MSRENLPHHRQLFQRLTKLQVHYLWGRQNCIAVELWGKKVQFWKSSGNLALISTERNCTYTYMTELSLYEVKMTKFVAERLDLWCHHRTALSHFWGKTDIKMHKALSCVTEESVLLCLKNLRDNHQQSLAANNVD